MGVRLDNGRLFMDIRVEKREQGRINLIPIDFLVEACMAIMEESTNVPTDASSSGQGGGAEAGVGFGAGSGAWDLKATYSYLSATVNAESNLAVSFGVSF